MYVCYFSLHQQTLALGHCHLLSGSKIRYYCHTIGFNKANILDRPLSLLSKNPKPKYDGGSPFSSSSTRSYAATTRHAPSRRCRTSSAWNMCGVTGLAPTSLRGERTRCSDSSLAWRFIRYCGKPTFSMPSSRAPTGMPRCAVDLSGDR